MRRLSGRQAAGGIPTACVSVGPIAFAGEAFDEFEFRALQGRTIRCHTWPFDEFDPPCAFAICVPIAAQRPVQSAAERRRSRTPGETHPAYCWLCGMREAQRRSHTHIVTCWSENVGCERPSSGTHPVVKGWWAHPPTSSVAGHVGCGDAAAESHPSGDTPGTVLDAPHLLAVGCARPNTPASGDTPGMPSLAGHVECPVPRSLRQRGGAPRFVQQHHARVVGGVPAGSGAQPQSEKGLKTERP